MPVRAISTASAGNRPNVSPAANRPISWVRGMASSVAPLWTTPRGRVITKQSSYRFAFKYTIRLQGKNVG
jgi:hypothetical protein